MPAENEVRITLTQIYEKQLEQGEKVTNALGEINTAIAVLTESVKPQIGINAEVFRRLLSVEKRVWAIPSGAVIIALIGVVVAYIRP